MTRLTLYTRPDCCLCDEALEVIERVRIEIPFELRKLDISSDPVLVERYGELLPVLLIDSEKAFELHVDERGLRDKLAKGRSR
ncbi:MAG: glutaredoxin family protein [Solirubrobacterales bacterium]